MAPLRPRGDEATSHQPGEVEARGRAGHSRQEGELAGRDLPAVGEREEHRHPGGIGEEGGDGGDGGICKHGLRISKLSFV
jgi:hypothetical protein